MQILLKEDCGMGRESEFTMKFVMSTRSNPLPRPPATVIKISCPSPANGNWCAILPSLLNKNFMRPPRRVKNLPNFFWKVYDFFPHSNDNGTKAIPPTNASESENNDSDNHWQLHACRLPQEKLCCGRLHRSLLRLYRPQSAVSCSTLRERAAWSPPSASQVSLTKWT